MAEEEKEKEDVWARRALDGHRERKENQLLAATESANVALKGLLLLNGGAGIALLAFLANVVKDEASSEAAKKLVFSIYDSLGMFAFGAAAAVAAAGLGYLSNRAYAECIGARTQSLTHPYIRWNKTSKFWALIASVFNIFGILSAGLSLYLFVSGVGGIRIS